MPIFSNLVRDIIRVFEPARSPMIDRSFDVFGGSNITTAIIGAGAIGHAIATQFSRKNIEVMLANSKDPSSLSEIVRDLGDKIHAVTAEIALAADVVVLAIPFGAIPGLLTKAPGDWNGRVIVDASNAIEFPAFKPADLGGRLSTEIVASLAPGARVVKAFNTIPARTLSEVPTQTGGRRIVVLSGDDAEARSDISSLIERLGFAALDLGTLHQASHLQQFGGKLVALDLLRVG